MRARDCGNRWLTLALACAVLAQGAAAQAAQTITICKATAPAGGSGFPFTWANGGGSLPSFTLNDGQCKVFDVTQQDHFNKFSETVPSGWTLSDIVCTFTTSVVKIVGADPNPSFQPGDNTVTMDLNEANVTCTFINQVPPNCKAQICVKKFRDINGNGVQDSGDPVLPGWTFQVKDSSSTVIATITTGPQGTACASVPAPATYTISEVLQSGWSPTLPPSGTQTVTVSAGQAVSLSFGNKTRRRGGFVTGH
jgi:hypothetical protein